MKCPDSFKNMIAVTRKEFILFYFYFLPGTLLSLPTAATRKGNVISFNDSLQPPEPR